MNRRLAAGVAGALVSLAACAAYSLEEQPNVAGSNTVAPLFDAATLSPGTEACRGIARLPAKVNRIRVFPIGVEPAPGKLRVTLADDSGVIAEGVNNDVFVNATLPIRLDRSTRGAHPARICFSNTGAGHIVLAGEEKRVRVAPDAPSGRQRVPSVVFLRRGSSTWAGRAGLIADRFAGANHGFFGGWTLWAAAAMLIAVVLLALWWLVVRLQPNAA